MLTPTTLGSMNYNVLRNIILKGNIIRLGRGAEIGVLYGDTSSYLLKELPTLTLYSVDPYVEYNDDAEGRPQSQLSNYEVIARGRLAEFGDRSVMIKKFSVEAAQSFQDGSLDFVFIDANHNYDSIKEDIRAWYPKVRHAGLFSGHDYKGFAGVQQAVNEFAAERNAEGFCTPIDSDIWFFIKPD